MATGNLSYVQYLGDGTEVDYSVPFRYLQKSHVDVTVDGTSVAFTWNTDNSIKLDSPAANGLVIEIRRTTPREDRLVLFTDGSTDTARVKNISADQTFFVVQEAFDSANATLAVISDGSYSAQTRRITSIGDPVNAQDAASKNWVENAMTSQVNIATNKASAASTSANEASTSESNALSSANDASDSENAAASSASAASTSESNALTSESNASTSESNAADSAIAAAASWDDFDDRYLGAKATEPTADNDGDALQTGALYFDTALNAMKVYSGTAWLSTNYDSSNVAITGGSVEDASITFTGKTESEHTTFTGAAGEVTVNTTNDSVHVHDGATAGGIELSRADGQNANMPTSAMPAGSVIQVVQVTSTTDTDTTSTSLVDVQPSVTITPSSASNKILVMHTAGGMIKGASHDIRFELQRNGVQVWKADRYGYSDQTEWTPLPWNASYLDSPNTTSSVTYNFAMQTSNAVDIRHNSDNSSVSGLSTALTIAMEIAG